MTRNIILCDIDHTVSDAFWRDPMMGQPWDEYHAASVDDKPLDDVVQMLKALSAAGAEIVGLTARPGKWRKLTMDWLIKHEVPMDELLMRPDDNFRTAAPLKVELALARFPNIKDEVAFILDDREDVIAAFKGLGVTALQVHARKAAQ